MRFTEYLIEAAKYYHDTEELVNNMVPAIKKNSKLYRLPIIWRGWNAGKGSVYTHAEISGSTEREFMRGMSGLPSEYYEKKGFKDWVKDVVKALKFTPICCTYSYDQASFFGNPCVVVPESNFKIYQNPNVRDLATVNPSSKTETKGGVTSFIKTFKYDDEEVEKIVKGYKEDYSNRGNELLLKCNKYYVINVRGILWWSRNSKFKKINDIKELKTYQQVIDLIYNYRSYMNFLKKRRESK